MTFVVRVRWGSNQEPDGVIDAATAADAARDYLEQLNIDTLEVIRVGVWPSSDRSRTSQHNFRRIDGELTTTPLWSIEVRHGDRVGIAQSGLWEPSSTEAVMAARACFDRVVADEGTFVVTSVDTQIVERFMFQNINGVTVARAISPERDV